MVLTEGKEIGRFNLLAVPSQISHKCKGELFEAKKSHLQDAVLKRVLK